jgi:hypothetical protein
MTRLKLKASISNSVAVALLLLTSSVAWAGKRVVVLDFDGPQAESFHSDVERLVKKSFVLVPVSKWNKAATANEIERLSEKNVKMLCKKVGVDGVVSGKIEKRREDYIVRLKLRECASGEMVGNPIDVKTSGPRLDGGASRTLREELTDAINSLATGGSGGGDDSDDDSDSSDEGHKKNFGGKNKAGSDDDADADEPDSKPAKPPKGKKPVADDDADSKPVKPPKGKKPVADDDADADSKPAKPPKGKKPVADDDADADADADADSKPVKPPKGKKPVADDDADADSKPVKPPKGKKPVDDDAEVSDGKHSDDDDSPLSTKPHRKPKKEVADKDNDDGGEVRKPDDDDDVDDAEETKLAWSERAVDAKLGVSFLNRRLKFTSAAMDPANRPNGYKGPNAPAAYLDIDIFPLALGHKRSGIAKDIGLTVGFDRVIKLQSTVNYDDSGPKSAKVSTTSQRFAIGLVFRHAFGKGVTAPVVEARVRFGTKKFALSEAGLPAGAVGVPAVSYKNIDPSLGIIFPLSSKIAINASGGMMLITDTGAMQAAENYGPAKVLGLEADLGVDYRLTKAIFIHAGFQMATVGFKFKNEGTRTTMGEVSAARDTYLGGIATAGFAY